MRKTLREISDISRSYLEANIVSVVAIGLDYGLDIHVSRYSYCTVVELKQYYTNKDSECALDGVEVTFYHDSGAIFMNHVIYKRSEDRPVKIDHHHCDDFNSDVLDYILRIVWYIENE